MSGASLAVLWPLLILAQAPDENGAADRPKLNTVSIEGVVVQVTPTGLVVRTEEGTDYAAGLSPQRVFKKQKFEDVPAPEVSISGTGAPAHVAAGVFVDFEMDLGPRREARFIIPSLRVFTPTKETLLGCFPRKADGGVAERPLPFNQVGQGRWRIVGRISALKGNDVAVAVPGGAIRGRIANTPLVQLEVADHRFARVGDWATLEGVSPELPHVFATRLTVKRTGKPNRIPPRRDENALAAGGPPDPKKPEDGDLPDLPDVNFGAGSGFPRPGGESETPEIDDAPQPAEPAAVSWEDRWANEKETWTDKSGRFAIEAVYDAYLGKGKIRLLRKDESEIVVELSKLSENSRRRAVELERAKKE